MSDKIFLDNWSTTSNPYQAPEIRKTYLQGEVFGHPNFQEGDKVYTSHIVQSEGRWIKTSSGSEYILGQPHPNYITWCEDHNITLNPDNPIIWR